MTEYKIYHDDDYSALYEDGIMVRDGDLYYIQEYLEQKLGVVNVYDVDFVDPETERAFDTLEKLEEHAAPSSLITAPTIAPNPDVFLAGGISGTTDWQTDIGGAPCLHRYASCQSAQARNDG